MPPSVVSIIPATVSFEVGASVPSLTRPFLSSKIVVSPMNELLLVNPAHLVSLPTVPLPRTGRFGPAASGVMLNKGALDFTRLLDDIRLKLERRLGRACASNPENLHSDF